MEKRVGALFKEVDADLTEEEKRGRLDIAYRKTAGQHVIIELKRPDRSVATWEIIRQIGKYRSGILKLLAEQRTPNEPVEFVLLLGKDPQDWTTPRAKEDSLESLKPYGARIVFYGQLLNDAYSAYADYLEKKQIVDRLGEVMRAIDDYAPPTEAEAADQDEAAA